MGKGIAGKVSLAVASMTLWLGACGSGTLGTGSNPHDSVLTPAVVSAVFQSQGGGFGSLPPADAACDPGKWSYVITLETQDVTWNGCTVNGALSDPASYVPASVDHPVDAAHWSAVHAALAAVTVSDRTSCGADKDRESLTMSTATDSVTYGDDFYACAKQYPRFVASDSLANLYQTLASLP